MVFLANARCLSQPRHRDAIAWLRACGRVNPPPDIEKDDIGAGTMRAKESFFSIKEAMRTGPEKGPGKGDGSRFLTGRRSLSNFMRWHDALDPFKVGWLITC